MIHDISDLNKRIIVQQQVVTRGSSGGTKNNWSEFQKLWAKKTDTGGREFLSYGAVHAETTTIFEIRYREDLTESMRILFRNFIYEIISIAEVEKDWLIIQAKKGLAV